MSAVTHNIDSQSPVMVVLGGNAFARADRPLTMEGQFEFAECILGKLRPLFESKRPVVITHGNGPQVGHMLTRVAAAGSTAYGIPLGVCVAETEGELGYVLQQSLFNVLAMDSFDRQVVSLLTQVLVDENDSAFARPTKAVGPVCSEEQTKKLQAQGICVRVDKGKGLRRMVPSPRPIAIIEADIVRSLLRENVIVVCAGGGGIPVVKCDGLLHGVDAVVDKDFASALLGEELEARDMITITDVPHAFQNFQTESEQAIRTVDVATARRLIADDQFWVGSMLPKMEAACQFCERPGTRAVICSPENLDEALCGDSGTIIEQGRGP